MLALEYDPVLAREAAFAEGFKIGFKQGIDIARKQAAKNLLAMNLSTDDIMKATGLTAEQIRKLADTNGGEHTLTNAILFDERDNVATCTSAAHKGNTIKILGGDEIVCVEDIPIWHKVALKPIVAGEKIFKYGEIIGEAASDIAAGAWVSHENIFSVPRDYQCEFLAEVHS